MVHNAAEGLFPQIALADAGVAVLLCAAGVETVVDMNGLQAVKTDHPVKFRQHAVQTMDDVIPRVGHMAGVQTNAHLIGELYPVKDLTQLLEPAAHLRALARHGLQQHRGMDIRRQDGVQRFGDERDAGLDALSGVAAGMEIVEIAGQVLHAL